MAGRVVLGLAVVVAAVVLLIALKDEGGEGSGAKDGGTAAQTNAAGGAGSEAGGGHGGHAPVVIVVKGGKPVGGIAELVVGAGERAHFRVESDVADEIHLHGYELTKEVEAGGSVAFDFAATIEGAFEAELEDRGIQILELQVIP